MKISSIFILMMILMTACNVADQSAPKNVQEENIANTPQFQTQSFAFSNNIIDRTESISNYSFQLQRFGDNFPASQNVFIRIDGTADLNDITTFTVDGAIPSIIGGDTFVVNFSQVETFKNINIVLADDSVYEGLEIFRFNILPNTNEYSLSGNNSLAIRINDNDPFPQINFAASSGMSAEGSSYNIVIQTTALHKEDIIVPLNFISSSSTANNVNDFVFNNDIIVFNASTTQTQMISIPVSSDLFNELDENAFFALGAPINASLGLIATHDLTITDPSANPTIALTSPTFSVTESGVSTTISAVLTGNIEDEIRLPFTLTPATLTPLQGLDYTLSANEFVFPAGSLSGSIASITLNAIDDDLFEGSESFILTLGTSSYATAAAPMSTTVTILDNESTPSIRIAGDSYQTTEGVTFQLPIFLSEKSAMPITINYSTAGSATATTDYSLGVTGSFTIPSGVKFFPLPIYINPDGTYDQGENFNISFTGISAGATIDITGDDATVTLNEPGALATVGFQSNYQNITESNNASVTIAISQLSENSHSFDLDVEYITATAADHTAFVSADLTRCTVVGTTVTLNPNQLSCTINIPSFNDTLDEPTEQFKVSLLQPANLVLGSITSKNIDITDNDIASSIQIAFDAGMTIPAAIVNEGNNHTIFYALDKPSGYDLSINLELLALSTATDTQDFTIPSYTINIPAGGTTGSFILNTVSDNIFEINETAVLTIAPGSNYSAGPLGTILNEIANLTPGPTLSIKDDSATFTLNPNENDTVALEFELTNPSHEDITFEYTLSCSVPTCADLNEDIESISQPTGQITIPAGDTVVSTTFNILADNLYEGPVDEQIDFTITSIVSGVANINLFENEMIISINDTDLPSEARFIGAKTVSISEAVEDDLGTADPIIENRVSIPIHLSVPSFEDSTFTVQILQTSDTSKFKADQNDFNSAAFTGSFINGATLGVGTPLYPTTTNSPITYANDIVYSRVITIPAGESQYLIDFALNTNDNIFEGEEQFYVKIDSAAAPYSVNTVHDLFTVNIVEKSSQPTVSIVSPLTGNLIDEDNSAPISANQTLNGPYDASALTDLLYTFAVTSFHQHQEIKFDLVFSGTAEYSNSFTDRDQFILRDYQIIEPAITANTGRLRSNNSFSYTISPEYSDNAAHLSETLLIQISKDRRYEANETIIATLTNFENTFSVTPTHTTNIINDDAKPTLVTTLNNGISVSEEVNDNKMVFTVTKDTDLEGQYATQIPIIITNELNKDHRQTSTNTAQSLSPTTLNSANNFEAEIELNPGIIGDNRNFLSIDISTTPDDNVVNTITSTQTLSFTVPPMTVKPSKDSQVISSSAGHYRGHTCSLFRGMVTCFGDNTYGQLGRGNTLSFGGEATDNISDLSQTVDLGTDQFNRPHYVVDIAMGYDFTCALLANKKVKCWGRNQNGQLGYEDTNNRGDTPGSMGNNLPFLDLGTNVDAIKISAGREFACIQNENPTGGTTSQIKCWGNNSFGQLGIVAQTGGTIPSNTDNRIGNAPGEMGDFLPEINIDENISFLESGFYHSCIYSNSGGSNFVRCWGYGINGELGHNTGDSIHNPDDAGFPRAVNIFTNNIVKLELGANHTCVIYNSGIFPHTKYNSRCFGRNDSGQLGITTINGFGSFYSGVYSSTGSGTNYTRSLGYTNSSQSRLLDFDGIDSTTTPDHANIPSNTLVAPSFIAIGNTEIRNQYIQVRGPASDLAAGRYHTCGVYDSYYDRSGNLQTAKNIKCWGANKRSSSANFELGVLNNIGSQSSFNGNYDGGLLIPYAGTGSIPALSQDKNFIGDNAADIDGVTSGTPYVFNHFDTDGDPLTTYFWGWVSNFFQELGVYETLNFEMNYYYSMSRESSSLINTLSDADALNDVTDIKLNSGSHHTCAVVERALYGEEENINDKYEFMCWGSNANGQLAMPTSTCMIIGGSTTCTNQSLSRHKFTYFFD